MLTARSYEMHSAQFWCTWLPVTRLEQTQYMTQLWDACAPEGLDVLALLVQVVQERVVRLVEQVPRRRRQPRKDVTRAGRVLAALQPRPELTCGMTVQRVTQGAVGTQLA